jgi:DNA-binding transcriptional LysR family regulator
VGRYLQGARPPRDGPRLIEVEQLATVIGLVRAGIGLAAIPQLNLYDFHYPDIERPESHRAGVSAGGRRLPEPHASGSG